MNRANIDIYMERAKVITRNGIATIHYYDEFGNRKRVSTKNKATPKYLMYLGNMGNLKDVLLKLIDKKKQPIPHDIASFGYMAIESRHKTHKLDEDTVKGYKQLHRNHIIPYFGHLHIEDITPMDIIVFQSFLQTEKNLMLSGVLGVRTVLKIIFSNAELRKIISSSPVKKQTKPIDIKDGNNVYVDAYDEENDGRVEPFTFDEMLMMISKSDLWFSNFIVVRFFTGMRTGEVIALKWDDIDWNKKEIKIKRAMVKGKLKIPKVKSYRTLDMEKPVEYVLKLIQEEARSDEWIFIHSRGSNYKDSSSLNKNKWKPLLKKCGLKHRSPYQTRHTFATLMFLHGQNEMWVSRKMLGHTTTETTHRNYAKFMQNLPRVPKDYDTMIDTVLTHLKNR